MLLYFRHSYLVFCTFEQRLQTALRILDLDVGVTGNLSMVGFVSFTYEMPGPVTYLCIAGLFELVLVCCIE